MTNQAVGVLLQDSRIGPGAKNLRRLRLPLHTSVQLQEHWRSKPQR